MIKSRKMREEELEHIRNAKFVQNFDLKSPKRRGCLGDQVVWNESHRNRTLGHDLACTISVYIPYLRCCERGHIHLVFAKDREFLVHMIDSQLHKRILLHGFSWISLTGCDVMTLLAQELSRSNNHAYSLYQLSCLPLRVSIACGWTVSYWADF